MRIIQRFGRVDRIGSRNEVIQLVNFWPDISLDEYINLKGRVESRMKIVNIAATGDENLLTPEEKTDLEYRKQQLQRLMDEVVDMEDLGTGISITDLGLNEFRMDLTAYLKKHPELAQAPLGLYAVAPAKGEVGPGILFVLRKLEDSPEKDRQNRLHPFYLVHVGGDGSVLCDHLHPKQALDSLRLVCKGQAEPIPALYEAFNQETRDGQDMRRQTELLQAAVASMVEHKAQKDVESLFKPGGTTALQGQFANLDDFELVCFVVIKEEIV